MIRIINNILSLSLLIFFCFSSTALAGNRLALVVTIIRHGDRTPVYDIAGSPYRWSPGIGEVTPLGLHEEYLLGKRFRTRYVEQMGFLPPQYRENSVYARSTNYNRTIMSAQAFLCGFYPPGSGPLLDDGSPALPGGFQPIPVRTLPEAQDLILLGNHVHKDKFNEMVREYVCAADEWKKMNFTYRDRFDRWSEILGVKIRDLRDLILPGDNLYVRTLKGIRMPEGLTEGEAREIIRLFQWAMVQQCRPRIISCLIARDFMHELVNDMKKAADGTQKYDFLLYTGHDTSILPVMSMLGAPLNATPAYSSNVTFELYCNGSSFYVKVRYNDNDIMLPYADGNGVCTLEKFSSAVLDESW